MAEDKAFFEELQGDFLNESAFMLEQYEESMIKLETSADPAKDLTDIFRVAHSVKGGAAAVGLPDLAKFAHVMEDLLDLLRSKPELVNPNAISLLLVSGDELKNRVFALREGKAGPWETSNLVAQLIALTESLSGKTSAHVHAPVLPAKTKEFDYELGDDFFAGLNLEAFHPAKKNVKVNDGNDDIFLKEASSGHSSSDANPSEGSVKIQEDHTNYDLLAEILGQLPEEERQKYTEPVQPKANQPATPPTLTSATVGNDQVHSQPESVTLPEKTPSLNTKVSVAAARVPIAVPVPKTPPLSTNSSDGGSSHKPTSKAASVIKVDTGRVDSVLDAVGELVVLKNQLVHDESIRNGVNLRLEAIVDQLDKAVRELYDKTLSIRMTPLKSMFIKIQRIVRDLSLNLGKPVDLQLIGEETEVERTVFEILGDPLVHLVRNSMDHGVESQELRQQRGKPAVAKVTVSAKQNGGNVIIEISDDGGGINKEKVLKKAIEKGLIRYGIDPASLPSETVFQFIFNPGFSTADKVSDLSGRGVGLDVVKSNLDKINGKINIQSKEGLGTTFRLTIPLSTAITDGIIVALDGARYILPIHSIREIVRVVPQDYTHISNVGKVANIRGNLLPVVDVSKILGTINWKLSLNDPKLDRKKDNSLSARREETMLVIIETMVGHMAFAVDSVLGQAQVVVKPIITGFNIPEVAGAAILGDGRTVLILDPGALIHHSTMPSESAA